MKYFVASSLDGFIARQDGSLDWLFMDRDYGIAEFFGSVDVAVMSRKTYDKMVELSPAQAFFPNIDNYVFSRTKPESMHGLVKFVSEDIETWTNQRARSNDAFERARNNQARYRIVLTN